MSEPWTLDQPLYTIAKQIQWNWPSHYGEQRFVCILGSLHTEMAALETLGDWLGRSGWTTALVNAKITTSGKAESMLHASHVVRSRHAHQVMAASLYILHERAYSSYVNRQKTAHGPIDDFDRWCELQSGKSPTV